MPRGRFALHPLVVSEKAGRVPKQSISGWVRVWLRRWSCRWQYRELAAIRMLYLMFVRLIGWLAQHEQFGGPRLWRPTVCQAGSASRRARTKMRLSRRRDADDHDALRLTLAVAAAHRICRLLVSHRLAARREATVTFTPARAIPKPDLER
jgi:hypothetical protein